MYVSQKCWCRSYDMYRFTVSVVLQQRQHSSWRLRAPAPTVLERRGMRLMQILSAHSWKEKQKTATGLSTKRQRIRPRPNTHKKRIFWPSSHHAERKPILTLFTTNSTFHSFYSLSWQLLPTRGNSLESNCQESTALAFREGERKSSKERAGEEEMRRHNR